MNQHLKNIQDLLLRIQQISEQDTEALMKAIKNADKEFAITEFKLDRTEKVKRTTAILLEETIEELEQKRKAIEDTNAALQKSLQELTATQAQLIQSEKMASLGELTAGIAHEIQNPLNFVNNFSEVSKELLEEMKTELDLGNIADAKDIANDVIQNLLKVAHHGKRADGIVKGMLQHSRSSSAVKEPTDINALADEYIRLCYHGLRAKDKSFNAIIKTDFDASLEKINIIPQDIGRVILNLLTNAFYAVNEKKKECQAEPVEAHPPYEPTVSVSTKKLNDKVEISVVDNGNGIPQQIVDKIFQPFFTTKPTGQGTGLGLSLSYDIITKGHGGELKVQTKVDEGNPDNFGKEEGTTFTISLPVNNN
jgi:signal transduction histidine kinase